MKPPKPKPLWVAFDNYGDPVKFAETRKDLIDKLEWTCFGWVDPRWQDNFTIIKYIPAKARKK